MSANLFKSGDSGPGIYLKGALIGVVVTVVSMLISAAAIILFNLDRIYSVPLGTLSLAFGSFSAAYYVSKKVQTKGYLIGALIGLITFALITVISLIVNRNGLTINTVFHLIIIVLSSAIGGILGVNKGNNKKYI